MSEVVALLKKYDCEKHAYFMTTSDEKIKKLKAYAPHLRCCVGHDENRPWEIVERAIALGAEKVQLFKPYFNRETVEKAHAHGIRCNVFWAEDIDEANAYLDMGIDCILTNDYLAIKNGVKEKFGK